ncbi:tape measure protein [Limosilactobacillus reuteri]|uniref:tape measure protein n=1 Tax=Limosilactobacillus reuteri TaxID=1598 RepID=UPI000A1DC127|nr:tape measure protein [Limosilactobacillus reuteri]
MAADSTVNIDVILNGDQAQSKAKEIDDILSGIGKDAGDKASDSITQNMNESKSKVEESSNEIVNSLKKIPKNTIIKLKTQAEKQGIDNFDSLLKKLPKEVLTKLISKANDGQVINYEKLLKQLPTKVITNIKLNDNASSQLTALKHEAVETEHSFSRLHDIVAGSFIGNLAANSLTTLTGYISDTAHEALSASDAINKFKSTMKLGGWGEKEIAASAKEVQKYANDTVYELGDVSNTAAQLASNGIKNYMQLTEAAGNLNAQAGGTAETFKSVAMVMTQTAGEGKLTAENWNQLIDAIPGASGVLQEQMKKNGVYTGNFRDAMAKGKISADDLNKAMLQLGSNKGAVEAAKSTSTFEGAFGNLKAQVVTGIQEMIDKLGKKKMTDIINTITDSVLHLTNFILKLFEVISEHRKIAVSLGAVLTAVFATKKISDFIIYLGRAKKALTEFGLASKAIDAIGGNASPALSIGKGTATTGAAMAPRLLSFAGRAVPVAAASFAVGNELISNNSTSQKAGGSAGAITGAIGGSALGGAIGTMIAPGIGTAVGQMLGGTLGTWAGTKLGEAIGKGANEHLKAHPITVKTKYKTSADNKAMDKDLTPSIDKVNKTVLRMDVDSASIQKAQQKTDKYFDEMSKKVDSYYKKKADGYKKDEEASKKNLDTLVKNGQLTQAEADKELKKQQANDQKKIKSDDEAAKRRKNVLEQMRKDTNDYYAKVSKIENDANKSEKQKQKELQKAQAAYVKKQYKDQLDANKKITSYVRQGANTQEKIYEQLVKKRGQLDMKDLKATQKAANQKYNAAVKPAQKARNEIVKQANAQYKETVNAAKKEFHDGTKEHERKYREIVKSAKAQRDGVTKAADDEYNKTTKKASDEHKKVTGEINQQKNDVINAANAQSSSHISAAGAEMSGVNGNYSSGFSGAGRIWNKFLDGVKAVLKFFNQNSKGVPSVPTGYAVGTGALTSNQIALVGEEGPELAHTPQGYEMLGVNGPELRYLSAGTSILTHGQTKTAMALNGGKIPGYAKGTGAKIADFVDDVKDDAMDALDLLGKGVSEVWDWLKQKTGLDSMLSSQRSMGGVKRTTHGTFDYAKDAISSFIKKVADKFLESLSGSVSPELVKAAAKLMHVDVSAGDVSHILNVIQHESGGKSGAVNNWDSNAKAGHPSKGILQFVQSTFDNYAMPGHHNILNPLDQLLAMFNDSTWRSDLTLGGWSPRGGRRYANGGWTDEPAIFGEIQGEPEVAINPKRDSSEEHIAEAIEARAKVNPNGFAGNLSKIINEAKQSANNMLPFISTGNNHVQATSNTQQTQPRVDGNINITMNIDSKQVSRAVYPTLKAMRSHEVIINGVGGAVPVGNGQPLGGVY